MPRKHFLQDMKAAVKPGLFDFVSDVKHGEDDGSLRFLVTFPTLPAGGVGIIAVIPDLGDYPRQHQYLLFAEHEKNTPPAIAQALDNLSSSVSGLSVSDMLGIVSATLQDTNEPQDLADAAFSDGDITDFEKEDDDELFFPTLSLKQPGKSESKVKESSDRPVLRQRIVADLRKAKEAGFRVGLYGELAHGGYLCLSCRVSKLGISEEAMKAWGVEPDQYLCLLIYYRRGYFRIEDVAECLHDTAIQFRIALCRHYKPSLTQIIDKFNDTAKLDYYDNTSGISSFRSLKEVEDIFISRSLNELMNKRFLGIVQVRLSRGLSWTAGEAFLNEAQGRGQESHEAHMKHLYSKSDQEHDQTLPEIVTADHIRDSSNPLSLPLCAGQFVLRHFVRCTEFCLNCHCKIEASFEALKPYVCSKPLCLYQFMHLGFGPSIEWEILTNQYVVDLLISFCYTAAVDYRLKEFPVGLGIEVPDPTGDYPQVPDNTSTPMTRSSHGTNMPKNITNTTSTPALTARIESEKLMLFFSGNPKASDCPFRIGQWLMLKGVTNVWHAMVEDTYGWPKSIRLKNVISTASPEETSLAKPKASNKKSQQLEVTCCPYRVPFDTLPDPAKQDAIVILLESLPSVSSMKQYLEQRSVGNGASLNHWRERISSYALDVLRWIIASNRSCIVQVDDLQEEHFASDSRTSPSAKTKQPTSLPPEDRVPGMQDWIQFRFAQGAPDKEQRFIDSVKSAQQRLKLQYPTIFAWHGSPLKNWHGIVREGLHFKDQLHGRAYGHGVYLSQDYNTSAAYITLSRSTLLPKNSKSYWPQSKIKVSCAIALNEVVNAPQEFVSKHPHLVVDKLDWIQARYLFVRGESTLRLNTHDRNPAEHYQQDPAMIVRGQAGPLVIPALAVSRSRRPNSAARKQGVKRYKVSVTEDSKDVSDDDESNDRRSIRTTDSDRDFLASEPDAGGDDVQSDNNIDEDYELDSDFDMGPFVSIPIKPSRKLDAGVRKVSHAPTTVTDFTPGTLDTTSLPLLKSPENASILTTTSLQRELKRVLQEQKSVPLHELGWYIDPELVTNMYQWIVEIHSFEKSLPLAGDMMRANIKSIVFEIRFTNNYPYSPPFVRVVRPRFLDFALGGGGHVTAGGAICMELLTNTGWNPASTMESVLLQVRMALTSSEPRPARLATERFRGQAYAVGEAIEAYKRACRTHGWQYPKEFENFATGIE